VWDAGAGRRRLTDLNGELFSRRSLAPVEELWVESSHDGLPIQAWMALPPDFDPERRHPLLLEIHGGPFANYGARFAAEIQLYAAAGYVVFMPNPTGSIGWGQAFTDAIRGDWGGKVYEDILKGTDYAETLPYVDEGRTVAAGASFGGYMVNCSTTMERPVRHYGGSGQPGVNRYLLVLQREQAFGGCSKG
jgi:acylaminoacyl-peptidase